MSSGHWLRNRNKLPSKSYFLRLKNSINCKELISESDTISLFRIMIIICTTSCVILCHGCCHPVSWLLYAIHPSTIHSLVLLCYLHPLPLSFLPTITLQYSTVQFNKHYKCTHILLDSLLIYLNPDFSRLAKEESLKLLKQNSKLNMIHTRHSW